MKSSILAFLLTLCYQSLDWLTHAEDGLTFEGHWESQWDFGPGVFHVLDSTGEASDQDDRAVLRGNGVIELGEGVMKMLGRPRYYIDNSDIGWRNVEMTGYATWVSDGTGFNSLSGFTMGARSSHDLYSHDGCTAFGYYAKIYRNTGQCSFQKEYYHDDDGNTVYSSTKRTDCLTMEDFEQGRTIGIKFSVTTLVDDTHQYADGSVELRLFLDRQGDGSSWELVHEYIDQPGTWNAVGGKQVPDTCAHGDGDTVLGAGNICFFRSDGSSTTQVNWSDASIANRFAYCTPRNKPCNENLDCCSGSCQVQNGETAGTCVGPSLLPRTTGVGGDPHFLRWGATQRESFHGACDLVLVSSEGFHHGAGLDVHVRTQMSADDSYSFVQQAAVRIGSHVLQIDNTNQIWFDGQALTFDALPLVFTSSGNDNDQHHHKYSYTLYPPQGRHGKEITRESFVDPRVTKFYRLDLDDDDGTIYMEFKLRGQFLSVKLHGTELDFADSVGLAGHHETGRMLSRIGEEMQHMSDHGMEWQVRNDEPQLFIDYNHGGPLHPHQACHLPTTTARRRRRRRLGEDKLAQQAALVCAEAHPNEVDLCVEDILITGDIDIIDTW